MRFAEWFKADEAVNAEYQEGLLASYLHKRLTEAVKNFFDDDRRDSLPQYLAKVLRNGDVQGDIGTFTIPDKIGRIAMLPEFKNWKLILQPLNERSFAYAGHGVIGLPYDKETLRNAQDFGDKSVSQMLERLDDQLVHECSHIISSKPGDDAKVVGKPYWEKYQKGTPQFEEARVKYYTDPGEIRAHARQYANIYLRRYGETFDQSKLERMAWELNDNKLFRFVNRLRDKTVQNQFPQMAERMNQAYLEFVKGVEHFVSQGRIVFS
jgi:hypothetical protein